MKRIDTKTLIVIAVSGLSLTVFGCAKAKDAAKGGVGGAYSNPTLLNAVEQDPFVANQLLAESGALQTDGVDPENLNEVDAKTLVNPQKVLSSSEEAKSSEAPQYLNRCKYTREEINREYEEAFTVFVQSILEGGPLKPVVSASYSMGEFNPFTDIIAELAQLRPINVKNTGSKGQIAIPLVNFKQTLIADATPASQAFESGKNCHYFNVEMKGMVEGAFQSLKKNFEVAPFGTAAEEMSYHHQNAHLHYGSKNATIENTSHYLYHTDYNKILKQTLAVYEKWERDHKQEISLKDYSAKLSPQEQLQAPNVRLADIREARAKIPGLFFPGVFSSKTRGDEFSAEFNKLIDYEKLLQNQDTFVNNYAAAHTVKGTRKLPAYGRLGAYQVYLDLLERTGGATGSVTAMQYTPIVLDTGAPGIALSSIEPIHSTSVFFDLGRQLFEGKRLPSGIKTAWISTVPTVNEKTGVVTPTVQDAILVQDINKLGTLRVEDLFGQYFRRDGKVFKTETGYETLREFVGRKKCILPADPMKPTEAEVFSQFVTALDPVFSKMGAWVDSNRNGRAEKGEIRSLVEMKIAAISVCEFSHKDHTDPFGNRTEHRAAMLMVTNGLELITRESELRAELFKRLTGNAHLDTDAFRASIDVHFTTTTQTPQGYDASKFTEDDFELLSKE